MKISHVAPLTLLLVEDNPADVFLVKEAMREEGLACEFHAVEDGEKAMAFMDRMDAGDEAPPDLLLLDLNVPRKSGDEVLVRIRKSPKCSNVAIIVITSSDSPHDRQRAKELGADEYFRKPANLEQFMELGKLARRVTEKCRGAVV